MDQKIIKIRDDLIIFMEDFCKIFKYEYKLENVFVFFGENVILLFVFKLQKEELDEEIIIEKC